MVIIGVGSNLGHRRLTLEKAIKMLTERVLSRVMLSPVYETPPLLPLNHPPEWKIPFLNMAVMGDTTLEPDELLQALKSIEKQLGRQERPMWAPREIDLDILAWDQRVIVQEHLTIPHEGLLERSFALYPLADVCPFWSFPCSGPFQGKSAEELALRLERPPMVAPLWPKLVGILNITPDSFSDGGRYFYPDKAIQHAISLHKAGATVLDIGGQSTRPRGAKIKEEEEWARLAPVLEPLCHYFTSQPDPPLLSIDTFYPTIAERSLALGIDWINDVTGLSDPAMIKLVAEKGATAVMMHSVTVPPIVGQGMPTDENIVKALEKWAEEKITFLTGQGISPSKLIIDPGIGFGKTFHQTLFLLKNIESFKSFGLPLLVGHSKKSFMSAFSDETILKEPRLLETLTFSIFLAMKKVDYIRVHDISNHTHLLKIISSLTG